MATAPNNPINDGFRWGDNVRNVDLSKFVKPHEGHLTHRSSPFFMWLADQLDKRRP